MWLGVAPEGTCVDQSLTGTNRDRPGLCEAFSAVRAGDILVVSKHDRLARSVPDARATADELTQRQPAAWQSPRLTASRAFRRRGRP
ncbi:MAG: recombinase family protein [Pseudonocardiales bacterium]|nr:recombinase family protein [Pseudonocardiales bacterium]MBV9650431.1 recombinase family protein [Pseudonocardiales bacterium]